jgi:vacuolar-type H+-ATPase subunit B/Vma2
VEKTAKKFRNLKEAEKADRDFYKELTGNERLQILVELLNHGPEQRLERISRITKLSRR